MTGLFRAADYGCCPIELLRVPSPVPSVCAELTSLARFKFYRLTACIHLNRGEIVQFFLIKTDEKLVNLNGRWPGILVLLSFLITPLDTHYTHALTTKIQR